MRRISHFRLGLFLLTCAAAGAVALIWIGATKVFEKTKTYAAFFADPVTGLESGAPVRHLGVRIGSVDSVELAPGARVVEVLVKLRPDFRPDPSMALQLAQAGITGGPYLELDEVRAQERTEPAHPPTKYPVLATTAGGSGIAAIEKKIASLDIEGLVKRFEGVASRIDALLGDRRLAEVGASAALLRQDLAQLKQAAIETQSLARSLRRAPGRVIEQPTTSDPFQR
jgi:phospholipid/cholesterol/gamma-HCH transport system substrate-binding protein